MENILKTILVEHEKSTFLVDLVSQNSGKQIIKIRQTFVDSAVERQELTIDIAVLQNIISALQNVEAEETIFSANSQKSYLLADKQKVIIERYFKGVTIQDLAMQFGCSSQIIEQTICKNGIDIVDNRLPKQTKPYRFRKKKK